MTTGTLTRLIEKQKFKEDKRRDYIGASGIGSDCLRQIWYDFTGAKAAPIPLKLRRTFEIGKRLESMVIDILRGTGLTIITPEDSPSQLKFIDSEYPFFQGSCDAVILNPERILEIKTAKDSSFNIFVKQGCKKWNNKYYAQLQCYMGLSGINSAYILVLNKDNSVFWDELVTFDNNVFQDLRHKAFLIKHAITPPPKVNSSPAWYQCKICKFRGICHK